RLVPRPYVHIHHRALYPFPTRRSSDLDRTWYGRVRIRRHWNRSDETVGTVPEEECDDSGSSCGPGIAGTTLYENHKGGMTDECILLRSLAPVENGYPEPDASAYLLSGAASVLCGDGRHFYFYHAGSQGDTDPVHDRVWRFHGCAHRCSTFSCGNLRK